MTQASNTAPTPRQAELSRRREYEAKREASECHKEHQMIRPTDASPFLVGLNMFGFWRLCTSDRYRTMLREGWF